MHRILEIPIQFTQRPLYRQNDPQRVETLMASIAEIGLQNPIDVFEVEGQYYGLSGCHRYEACTNLKHSTIRCCVRRAICSGLQKHLA